MSPTLLQAADQYWEATPPAQRQLLDSLLAPQGGPDMNLGCGGCGACRHLAGGSWRNNRAWHAC